jgi:hypothetical protein
MESNEAFQESKERLLTDFRNSGENDLCRKCHSQKKFRYSVLIPWLLSLALFVLWIITLGVSVTRSEKCIPKGYWDPTEFGMSTIQ